MQKTWVVAEQIDQKFRDLFPEQHPVILQLLHNRGITTQRQIDEFLNPDWGEDIHDPFLFRDMRKAVDRIFRALEAEEPIVVYGDYDADGVCSAVLLHDILTALGAKALHVHLPHRETEGYGLNTPAVKELIKRKAKLIITCDCGTSNVEEIALAQEKGIDVIITDHHHQPAELPQPYAFLNPQLSGETYPFPHLAGSGVAFKLAHALIIEDRHRKKILPDGYEKWLLDLVAISTVTDMMPLLGENRTLVHYGLVVLRKSRRVGVQELVRVMNGTMPTLDTFSIGFQIGPRLNAAGRMAHANAAFELLIESEADKAETLAENLQAKNKERQRLTESMVKQAEQQIGPKELRHKILFVYQEEWPAGLIGLVAGRLADRYHRPVMAMGARGAEIVGSGRSIPGFDITAALVAHKDHLTRFGGHAQACGFTIPKEGIVAFTKAFTGYADAALNDADLVSALHADMEIELEAITWELYEDVDKFEPFGERNPRPKFIARRVEIVDVQPVGQNAKHLRLLVRHRSDTVRKVIAFGFGNGHEMAFRSGEQIDILFEVSVNEWNGTRELQLKLIDAHHSV